MRTAAVAALVAVVLLGAGQSAVAAADPYASATFSVTTNSYTFGQDPEFMPDGRVVWGENRSGKSNDTQIWTAEPDGSRIHCLTCDTPGPNNVPIARPQGDWILYHSWRGHYFDIGSPGYGGLGSALWVMRPDGSDKTQLTETATGPFVNEGYDDYHAYWSPDGRRVVWAHLNWNFAAGGQGKWDIRVADFTVSASGMPSLSNVRVVRPANGHWYETQWWAPNGSGFLYTETTGTALDTELFFCRLTSTGCAVTQLTDSPSWNEQAVFTPNGRDVIFMSSRDHPGFFNLFAEAARDAGLTTSMDYLLILPVFEAAYFQPVATESTDLYELNLATRSLRRLTTEGDDGWVIPEFAWNPVTGALWWTELRYPPGTRVPLPIDLARQLDDEAQLVENPPPVPTAPGGNVNATVPIQSRTRILSFDLGGRSPVTAVSPGCRRAGGRVHGRALGPVTLGMTRARARRASACSAIRVGYGSARSLAPLGRRSRARLAGRVVWASTADRGYSVRGVRPGASLRAARAHLKLGRGFRVRSGVWYLGSDGPVVVVLDVRHGVVREIGIADPGLTHGRKARLRLVRSLR